MTMESRNQLKEKDRKNIEENERLNDLCVFDVFCDCTVFVLSGEREQEMMGKRQGNNQEII